MLAKTVAPSHFPHVAPGFPSLVVKITKLTSATLLALVITGCASNEIAARIRERSSVYATLPPAQQEKIEQGVIALGFTPDMVYMAMGLPSQVEPVEDTGGRAELWTYRNYYPQVDAAHMQQAGYRTEAPYQPSRTYAGSNVPIGSRRGQSAAAYTGGPQGAMTEPADLQAFTLRILFQDGKVKRMGIGPD